MITQSNQLNTRDRNKRMQYATRGNLFLFNALFFFFHAFDSLLNKKSMI